MADTEQTPQNPDAAQDGSVTEPGSVEETPNPQDASAAEQAVSDAMGGQSAEDEQVAEQATAGGEDAEQAEADVHPDTVLAAERLEDLRRAQADHLNYRNRMERERAKDKDAAVAGVVEALIPVLDDVHMARRAGDLTDGPMAAIATKLEGTLERFGVASFGEVGETFDPTRHEALMHTEAELPEGTTETTIVQVLQPGFSVGERIVRAARVAVADPA